MTPMSDNITRVLNAKHDGIVLGVYTTLMRSLGHLKSFVNEDEYRSIVLNAIIFICEEDFNMSRECVEGSFTELGLFGYIQE